jgi:hypothetical protein
MKHRIAHVSVHQTSKVLALVYGVLGFVFVPLLWIASVVDPTNAIPFVYALLFPVLYAVFGYIFTAISVALYNLIAGLTGGIEITLRPLEQPEWPV